MNSLDAGALIDGSPWTLYQKTLTALAAMAIVIDGFDIQILALSIPSLMRDWHVSRADFAPVLALGLAGMALGGPVFGHWGDRIGRRSALIASLFLFGLATAATSYIDSIWALAVLRFFTGLGAGGAVPNAGTLAAEFAPLRNRPAAVKLTIVCIPLGGMLGGLIAAQVLPGFGWRTLYLIGGLTPIVFSMVLFALLPESPRFLATRREGWPALAKFLQRAGHSSVALDSEFADRAEQAERSSAPIGVLVSATHLRQTVGLWIAFFSCMSAIYLVFGWLPALLASQGLSVAAASGGMATFNFGGVVGVLVWAVLTAVFGSRGPLLGGALGAAFCALALWFAPPSLLVPALAVHGFLSNAVQTSLYALATHVYPLAVRSSGVAWCASIGRTGGILSSLYGAVFIGLGAGAYWFAFAIAMAGTAIGLAIVSRHIPARNPKGHA